MIKIRFLFLIAMGIFSFLPAARAATITSGNITSSLPFGPGGPNTWQFGNSIIVGDTAPGTLTMSSFANASSMGQVSDLAVIANTAAASTSELAISNSSAFSVSNGTIQIGKSGAAIVNLSTGGNISAKTINLGANVGGDGTIAATSSGRIQLAQDIIVGDAGKGKITLTDGGLISGGGATGTIVIGNQAGSNGSITAGGVGQTSGINNFTLFDYYIGNSGTGTLELTSSNTIAFGRNAYIGNNATGNGTVTLKEAAQWRLSDTLYVAKDGAGTITVTNGATLESKNAYVGYNHEASVTIGGTTSPQMSPGGTWSNSNDFFVGFNSVGSLTLAPNAQMFTKNLTIGNGSGNSSNNSNVTVSTSTISTINALGATLTATTLTMNSATLNINQLGNVVIGSLITNGSNNNINMTDNSTLRFSSPAQSNIAVGANINLLNSSPFPAGKTISVPTGVTCNLNSVTGTGEGFLSLIGSGTFVFDRAQSYKAITGISGSKVVLSGAGSIANSSSISLISNAILDVSGITNQSANYGNGGFAVLNGQRLYGSGTVAGKMTINDGATLGATAPSFAHRLNTDSIVLAANSLFLNDVYLGSTLDADLLNVTGGVEINNSKLEINLLNTPVSPVSGTFLLVNNDLSDPVIGTFGALTFQNSNYALSVDYAFSGTDSLGRIGDGNDIAITLTAIPEPGMLVLLGIAACFLVALKRAQKHAGSLFHSAA